MKYKIAYQYIMSGVVEIEAASLEEAKDLSIELSVDYGFDRYVDGSFEINEEVTEELNKVSHE